LEKREDLFLEVLRSLQTAEILKYLILIGSWSQYFYRIHFNNSAEIPLLRTLDMDFLVPAGTRLKTEVHIPELLKILDFELVRHYPAGYMKFVHPDLAVEFLVSETGRGTGKPSEIRNLHINAQGLRFLSLLGNKVITVKYRGLKVIVPEPAAFVLHKFIIATRRSRKEKAARDTAVAVELGEFILRAEKERKKLQEIFQPLPKKWRNIILASAESVSPELHEFLTQPSASKK